MLPGLVVSVIGFGPVALLWISQRDTSGAGVPPAGRVTATTDSTSGSTTSITVSTIADEGTDSTGEPVDQPDANLAAELRRFLEDLRAKIPPTEVRARLVRLKELVHAADPHEAAAALIQELETDVDEPTGLRFVVGLEGVLDESPTYRTALLDLLGQTEPEASADYARVIMGDTPSADEYALALRNLAWTDFEGSLTGELTGHLAVMLGRADWMSDPTAGYLEAFDCAVFVGASDQMVPLLEPPSDQGESATGHAAFVALDRIMLRDSESITRKFRAEPQFMAKTPFHRASLLSRLDIRDPEQAALIKDYLLRADHAPEELQYFSEVFPNKNSFAGHRLITGWEEGFSIAEVDQSDSGTLRVVREWLGRPEFNSRQNELRSIANRLDLSLRGEDPASP